MICVSPHRFTLIIPLALHWVGSEVPIGIYTYDALQDQEFKFDLSQQARTSAISRRPSVQPPPVYKLPEEKTCCLHTLTRTSTFTLSVSDQVESLTKHRNSFENKSGPGGGGKVSGEDTHRHSDASNRAGTLVYVYIHLL